MSVPKNDKDLYTTLTACGTHSAHVCVITVILVTDSSCPFSQVPGVAENRPSVLRGDKLLVYPVGEPGVKYCGYVHSVHLDSVKLGFSSQ